MTASFLPIFLVDLIGSVLMIILSLLILVVVRRLKKQEPTSLIWTYLLWISIGLTGFSISRSAGHIAKQILILAGHQQVWKALSPYSGAFNTVMFVLVGSITLFFRQAWTINLDILADKRSLQHNKDQLLYMNQNLEKLVAERTQEVVRSEQKYRRIFELSKDMILVSDTDGRIIDTNPIALCLLSPRENEQLTGSSLKRFFSQESEWSRMLTKIREKGSVSNEEIEMTRDDGMAFRCLVTGCIDHGPAASADTVHFLIKDIERRRLMEQQMAQADKLASIGEFSAGIAHEINNPLGIILGYTQLMLRETDKESERYADLKTIEKHVRNCKSIVEDLLNFARSAPPEKERRNIHHLIDDVAHFIQQHTRSGRIEIRKSYDTDLPLLTLDEKKIRQVLMNLIMNARHAVGEQGTIDISTRYHPAEKEAEIQVSDTGYGIEKKDISRIFDPFFTTKPTGEGTGLGLSVSYGIIKSHGGRIDVKSNPGKGSSFTIHLPVDRSSQG